MSIETEAPSTPEPSIEEIAAQVFGEDKPAAVVDAPASKPEPEKAPESKTPDQERVSARILANQKAERAAAKARAEQTAREEAIAKREAEVSEMAKVAEAVKAAKLSPSKALELLGMTPKQFLETLANENEPEAIATRAMQGTQTEVQKLAAELEALKAERAAEREAIQKRESAQAIEQTSTAFVEHVAENADKYPTLVEVMTPDEIVAEGFKCLDEVVGHRSGKPVTRLQAYMDDHGKPPSDEEIAEFLEQRAQPRAQARNAWRERIGKSAPKAGMAVTEVARATQTERGPSPRTLTSRVASERASKAPEWSEEAADEESLRILNAALSRNG